MEWKDWGHEAEISASQFDQIAAIVAGFGKQELDPRHAYPRPGTNVPAEPDEPTTIAEFDISKFLKFMYG